MNTIENDQMVFLMVEDNESGITAAGQGFGGKS